MKNSTKIILAGIFTGVFVSFAFPIFPVRVETVAGLETGIWWHSASYYIGMPLKYSWKYLLGFPLVGACFGSVTSLISLAIFGESK